ncbi:hypothetical protein [Halostagnicola sp. A-GB9-2]|uniref:hypothetical protein n=1 Tax=Halostagnicola sp. A-GB9-2 TaxID=3048066 RepID=UPI0024BFD83D|nr:hypothetical protein [Halostagnicola sp. A-GB9-2]MDJ1431155.1 hypothetical protein [Halostagnicola sp. A-GB9-2]
MSQDTARRRLSTDVDEIIGKHAEQNNCTKREMLEKMVQAYDDRDDLVSINQRQTEKLDRLCDALLGDAETASTTDTVESDTENESESGTGLSVDTENHPDELSVDHDVELDPAERDWGEDVAPRAEPRVAAVRGFLNRELVNLDSIPEELLDDAIDVLDVHDSSVRRYKYEYGEDLDVWYPHPSADPNFKPNQIYDRVIEAKKDAAKRNKSKVTEKYPDLRSCFPHASEGWDDGDEDSPVVEKDVFFSDVGTRDSKLRELVSRTIDYIETYGSQTAGVIYLSYLIHFADQKDISLEAWRSAVRENWADHKYWVEDW